MRLLTVLATVVALVFLSATATAQVINACLKPNGTLKVVSAPGDCASNETPISWNVQGPKARQ